MQAKRLKLGTGEVHIGVMLTVAEAREAVSTMGPFVHGSGLLHRLAGAIRSELEDQELLDMAPSAASIPPPASSFTRQRVMTPAHEDLPPICRQPSPTPSMTPQPTSSTEWVVRVWKTRGFNGSSRDPHHSISRPFPNLGAAHDFFERTINAFQAKVNRGESTGYDVVLGRRNLKTGDGGKETGWEEIKVSKPGAANHKGTR